MKPETEYSNAAAHRAAVRNMARTELAERTRQPQQDEVAIARARKAAALAAVARFQFYRQR